MGVGRQVRDHRGPCSDPPESLPCLDREPTFCFREETDTDHPHEPSSPTVPPRVHRDSCSPLRPSPVSRKSGSRAGEGSWGRSGGGCPVSEWELTVSLGSICCRRRPSSWSSFRRRPSSSTSSSGRSSAGPSSPPGLVGPVQSRLRTTSPPGAPSYPRHSLRGGGGRRRRQREGTSEYEDGDVRTPGPPRVTSHHERSRRDLLEIGAGCNVGQV